MKKFITFLKGAWKFLNSRLFVMILITILILFLAGQCQRIINLQRQDTIHNQNESALKDSLKFERKKNGELLVSIDGYISTEKELKTLNKSLWEAVNDQKGKVIALSNVVIRLQQDSAMLAKYVDQLKTKIGMLTKVDEFTYTAPWVLAYVYDKDSTNTDVFSGRLNVGVLNRDPLELRINNFYMLKRDTKISLTWGQKVEKGKLRIFVQSAYPGFTVESLEGVLIDPNTNPFFKDLYKKKHWFTGFSVGPSMTAGWDFINNRSAIVVGASLHYSLYQW